MEKVKIKSAIDSGKVWNDKPIINVTLEDGRTGSSYDRAFIEKIGQEIDVDVKEGKVFNNVKQYYFNLPRDAANKKSFSQKDWTFEKKKAALDAAINTAKVDGTIQITEEKIIASANKYYEFLK